MEKRVLEYLNDQYKKVDCLKKSRRGTVWLAREISTGQYVIWKQVKLTGLPYKLLKQNPDSLWPRVKYCAEDSEAGDTVVIEEFNSGVTLGEIVAQGKRLDEENALKILLRLCDGLSRLHALGIIHRDIKPDNLKIFKGDVYLLDFDASREYSGEKDTDTTVIVTRRYAPPEQFGCGETDARSDIYALGRTLQELLGEDYDGRLKPILEKCTAFSPEDRYRSIAELKKDLEDEPWDFWKKVGIGVGGILLLGKIFFDDDN